MEKYQKYAENIPEEVRITIASLDNQIRQAILVLSSRNVELSFTDIQKELKLDKIKLNFHLKNLFSSALIDHYYRHQVGNQKYSYYSISQLGRRVLAYLIQAFIPPSPIAKDIVQPERYLKYSLDHHLRNIPHESFYSLQEEKKECLVATSPSLSEVELFHLEASTSSLGKYVKTAEQEI